MIFCGQTNDRLFDFSWATLFHFAPYCDAASSTRWWWVHASSFYWFSSLRLSNWVLFKISQIRSRKRCRILDRVLIDFVETITFHILPEPVRFSVFKARSRQTSSAPRIASSQSRRRFAESFIMSILRSEFGDCFVCVGVFRVVEITMTATSLIQLFAFWNIASVKSLMRLKSSY